MTAITRHHEIGELLKIVDRYREARIWVIGDLMLDEYVAGAVERISPEAPVPIVRVSNNEFRLGGAANVARQLSTLGADVSLCGLIGADAAGDDLLALCETCRIDTRAILKVADRRTTRKLRVLGHHQQLLRLDWEDSHACTTRQSEGMAALLDHKQSPDVVILSDYAKGVLTPAMMSTLLRMPALQQCPVLVDPKHRDFSRYRGATIITPNLRELETATGQKLDATDSDAIAQAARGVAEAADVQAIVVTLSEHGILVVPRSGTATAIPATRQDVYDVTGAGDTAIAVLGISLAARAPLPTAAHIANAAAGVSVAQVGAVAVTLESIRAALGQQPIGKVMKIDALAAQAASWRLAGKRIVFTNGCFDIVHAGHVALLNEAAKFGDLLVLAINSDASVRRLKGSTRPLVGEVERAALLAALACVDAVTIFDEDTPLQTLQRVRPHVLVKGQDYQLSEIVGREFVESIGGRVALVPLVPERSTSALVERIRAVS